MNGSILVSESKKQATVSSGIFRIVFDNGSFFNDLLAGRPEALS